MKLKTIFVILIAIMIIGMLPTMVKAEYSARVTMTPNKTQVNPGDTVNIVVALADVVDAGTGANEMQGTIGYDSDFFESVTASQGSWTMNEGNGKFTLGGTLLTGDGQFAILQLKVSENATGSTTVKFTDLKTANGSSAEPTSPDITLNFSVAESEEPQGDTNTAGNSAATQNTTNTTNSSGTSSTNSIRGNTTGNVTTATRLPNAGVKTGIIVAAVILIVLIAGSYLLYRYPKIK